MPEAVINPVEYKKQLQMLNTLKNRVSELEAQLEASKRPAPCERYCEQIAFKRTIAGLEKKLEAKDEQIEALQSSNASVEDMKTAISQIYDEMMSSNECGWVDQSGIDEIILIIESLDLDLSEQKESL